MQRNQPKRGEKNAAPKRYTKPPVTEKTKNTAMWRGHKNQPTNPQKNLQTNKPTHKKTYKQTNRQKTKQNDYEKPLHPPSPATPLLTRKNGEKREHRKKLESTRGYGRGCWIFSVTLGGHTPVVDIRLLLGVDAGHPAHDVDVAHLLPGNGLLLQDHIHCVPDDGPQHIPDAKQPRVKLATGVSHSNLG